MRTLTAYLGTKYDGHDSAAFLLLPHCEHAIGLSTERLTRIKHDAMFPLITICRLVGEAEELLRGVQRLCCANSFSSHQNRLYPVSRAKREYIERGLELPPFLSDTPPDRGYERLSDAMRRHLRLVVPSMDLSLSHFDHEYCHARSAYDFSPFRDALVLTMDGSGDNGTFSRAYVGRDGDLLDIACSASADRIVGAGHNRAFSKPCSLGGIYSYFTYLLGFEPNSEEGKLEALAAFGQPIQHISSALTRAVAINRHTRAIEIDSDRLRQLCSSPDMLEVRENMRADVAATAQAFLEDMMATYVSFLLDETGASNLCVSGGLFANVLMNKTLAARVRNRIYITPAMGDDGSAQGAAVAALLEDQPDVDRSWLRNLIMPYFGTAYTHNQVRATLESHSSEVTFQERSEHLEWEVASRIFSGQIGAVFRGRMEFGPRALGNRSVVASACHVSTRARINAIVKRRPPFQPVCPAVLEEELERLFVNAYPNKHMTCAFLMRNEYRAALPSAIHVDGTARVQAVSRQDNEWLWSVLKHLQSLQGFGVIVNTSFNLHGRAIVESPEHAIAEFVESGIDFLVMESFLILRGQNAAELLPRTKTPYEC